MPAFFYHLSLGETEGETWIAKPTPDWFLVFISYLFHYSRIVYVLFILLFFYGLYYFKKAKIGYYKMHIIAFVWAFSSFLIVYSYSVYKSPVLQFSTMTFSLPFLLMSVFSLYPELSGWVKTILVGTIICINLYTLITVRRHNEIFYKQPYEQLAKWSIKTIKDRGVENVTIAHSVVDGFIDYYFEKYNYKFSFLNIEKLAPKEFRDFVYKQTTDFFVAGHLPQEYIQIIKEKYPYLIEKEDGFTYTIYSFSKSKPDKELKESIVFTEENNFGKNTHHWFQDTTRVIQVFINHKGEKLYKMDSTIDYGPTFTAKLKDITDNKHNIINIQATLYADTVANPLLVIDIHDGAEQLVWKGADYDWYNYRMEDKNKIYISELLSGFDFQNHPNAEIKAYIWNKNKNNFYIKDITLEVVKGNPFIYGLYYPID